MTFKTQRSHVTHFESSIFFSLLRERSGFLLFFIFNLIYKHFHKLRFPSWDFQGMSSLVVCRWAPGKKLTKLLLVVLVQSSARPGGTSRHSRWPSHLIPGLCEPLLSFSNGNGLFLVTIPQCWVLRLQFAQSGKLSHSCQPPRMRCPFPTTGNAYS